MRAIAYCLSTLFVLACAGHDVSGPPLGDEPVTARALLDAQPSFQFSTVDQRVQLLARVDRGDHWVEEKTRLQMTRGEAVLAADPVTDELRIEALDLFLADIVAGKGTISEDGLHLTGLRVHLAELTRCHLSEWAEDDDSCYAEATVGMILDWSLQISDEVYGMGSQALDDIAVEIALQRIDERLELTLTAAAPGVFWDWAGIVEFADLGVTLQGTQAPLVR